MDTDVEYYGEYRAYIEDFVKTIDPVNKHAAVLKHDQLPLRVSGYCLRDYEIHGEIIDWLLIYLGRSCPTTLRIYLIQTALKKILEKVRVARDECGYDSNRDIYQPLKLVRVVVGIVNNLIIDLQDNAKLYEVPLPPTSPNASELTKLKQAPKVSVDAIKNSRRTMEDRHAIIEDFNAFFNTQDTEPTFYYGIFDGHSGSDAATYANSHLNYNISVHPSYPSDIKKAMQEAFLVTDIEFLKKAHAENLNSGTTALCAIYRKTQKKLFVGWCGDSQALISRLGNVHQIVRKHSPEDEAERKRIEDLGGVVLYWSNSFRVNGSLAVSRAIGDAMHKPFVSAEPEISVLNLDGEEDFFVMGCDGLWDTLTEDVIAITIYTRLKENPNNYRNIASELCTLAKSKGSRDNISVIVVFLKEPELIATQSWPSELAQNKDIMEDIFNPDQPKVSIDPLGNQDIMSNPFGDFMGKSTEITDLVMNQQHENEFVNLTDRFTSNLNSINNNMMNNGSHDADETNMMSVENLQNYQPQQDMLILNDDNNNSNNNFNSSDFGPETDVDAMEENDTQATVDEACGGEKEKSQMEFKEVDDVDRVEEPSFDLLGGATADFVLSKEESKENIAPFDPELTFEPMSMIPTEIAKNEEVPLHLDSEFTGCEQATTEGDLFGQETTSFEYSQESMQNPFASQQEFVPSAFMTQHDESIAEEELISANDVNEEVAIQQDSNEPKMSDLEIIGTAQAIEESDGSEDEEWNYIKVDDKKAFDGAVQSPIAEEHTQFENNHQQEIVEEAPVVDEEEKLIQDNEGQVAPKEDATEQLEENPTESDNKENIFEQEQKQTYDDVEEEEIIPEPIECKLVESSVESAEIDNNILPEEEVEELTPTQEKEPVEEERHVLDDIEKDLQLEVETEETNEMDSQLNPDAKEFVPLSPVRNEFHSPPHAENGKSPLVNPILSGFADPVVSQSPRKGEIPVMEDVQIPEEKEFDKEADARAHEISLHEENFQRIETPDGEEINLKEAMQADDKLEQGYKDDSQGFFEEEKLQSGDEYKELECSFDQYSNGFQNKIDDPMNRSFYEGRDSDILADPAKSVLNTTQPLLLDEDEESKQQAQQESKTQEVVDFLGESAEPVYEQVNVVNQLETAMPIMEKEPQMESQMESSDNFEAEKFVEEIKGINESNFNKYVDTELSPTGPNEIQTVEETIFATHSTMKPVEETNLDTFVTQTSTVSNIEVVQETKQSIIEEFGLREDEIKQNIPEEPIQQELIPTMEAPAHEVSPVVEDKPEVPIPEILTAAATVTAVAGATAIAAKKPATTAAKKPAVDSAAKKTTLAAKPKTADVKKTEVKPKTTVTKSSSATSTNKPPVSKPAPAKPSTATSTARPKPATASSTVPPVRKVPLSKPTEAKPPLSRPASSVPKRPISSAPTTKPTQPKPTEVKPKVNGTTERKPLVSSAPTARAPPKPSTLTMKSKVNGTTASSTAKSPSSATTKARLSSSVIEKASSPLKEKIANKSLSSTSTASKSPRPASSTVKSTTLKSPSSTAPKPLSAVGTKKPLTTVTKKSPTLDQKTTTTVTKKPPVGGNKTTTAVKKTTTTTVVKKKITNGDVVEEVKKTTVTETELNGHHVNGSAENGDVHEPQQPVVEQTAI